MKKEHVIFEEEVYDLTSVVEYVRKEVLPYVPYWSMGDLMEACDIRIDRYGFVHDCGCVVVIIAHGEQRHGLGWDSIDTVYRKEVEAVKEQWEFAMEYGYH
jgi:hypothetical protein